MNRLIQRGQKLIRLLLNEQYRRALFKGVPAAVEHESLIRRLEYNTLLDIGANIGQFTVMARALQPRLVAHLVEPIPSCIKILTRLYEGDDLIHIYPFAAGDVHQVTSINLSAKLDSSSLLAIGPLQEASFPGTSKVGSCKVTVARVDDIIDPKKLIRPVLVKMDVQGYELLALKGMRKVLELVDYIYIELSFIELYEGQPVAAEVFEWLASLGFLVTNVNTIAKNSMGITVQGDVLFSKDNSIRGAASRYE